MLEWGIRRLAWAGAIALALVTSPGLSAIAQERVEQTTTVESGTNGTDEGYWVVVKETVFNWEIQDWIDVVFYYRAYRGDWLRETRIGKFGDASSWDRSASKNEDQVKQAIEDVGWPEVHDYVKHHIPSAWQNQGIMIIDPEAAEIMGHLSVVNSYDARDTTKRMLDQVTEVTIMVPDEHGRRTKKKNVKIRVTASSVWASPIVLDLDGLGHPDLLAGPSWKLVPGRQVAHNALRAFDLDGKGLYAWEWIGPRSGLLAWDGDGKGQIRTGEQLFGNYTWGKQWRDGYEALATLDNNGDGTLTPDEFTNLVVWVDADSDGVSDPGETHSLTSLGILSLSVKAQRDRLGNASASKGFVRNVAGSQKTLATWDWISMGYASPSEGTYVWVGQDGDKKLGGYIKLHEQAGEIRGYAVPTIGTEPVPEGLLLAYPISGKRTGDTITWTLPSLDGPVTSEVRWNPGGKHLFGITRAETKTDKVEYLWQAELVSGEPIGAQASMGVARK